jgi:hypothetical protein
VEVEMNRFAKIAGKDIELLDVNLQLFAGDDDEDFDYDDSDLEDTDADDEDLDEDYDDDSEDGDAATEGDESEGDSSGSDGDEATEKAKAKVDAKPKGKDKITHALIKQKQLNRDLKAKLDLIEKKDREAEQQNRRKTLADKLIEKGYDDDEAYSKADEQLENEAIKSSVRKLEFMTENADILAKYPLAKKNVEKLLKLQKATGWSVEKICRTEYAVAESAFDNKVKSDQEQRLKNKKRTSTTPAGGQTPIQSLKLDPEDERAYQFYSKKHPGVSRKQYVSNLNQASSQKIPHDSWD